MIFSTMEIILKWHESTLIYTGLKLCEAFLGHPVFPKLQTPKDMVKQMSKKPRFRTPFNSQHIKASQTLLKSLWLRFYHICSTL